MTTITVKEPRVEELKENAKETLSKDNVSIDEYNELKADFDRHKEELNELYNKKMEWNSNQRNDAQFSDKDIADAYMIAKIKGVDPRETTLGKKMEKAITTVDAFQAGFTRDIQRQLEAALTVAPEFPQIQVNSESLTYPVVAKGSERASKFPSGKYAVHPDESTNVAVASQTAIGGVALSPIRYARRTWLSRQEAYDNMIPILEAQRLGAAGAIAREMDRDILRGDGTLSAITLTPTNYQATFKGVSTLATDVGGNGLNLWTNNVSSKATVLNVATARSMMGVYGLDPSKLVYYTTIEGYHNFISSDYFMTVDKYGPNATLVKGELGRIWGIPVKVSEFIDNTGSNTNVIGTLVYTPGFMRGMGRAATIESQYDPDLQMDKFNISSYMDFKALTTESSAALSNSWSMATTITSTYAE